MDVPDRLFKLDEKPGKEWSSDDIEFLTRWWMRREQERFVWYCAARYLGTGAVVQDVEDMWLDFYKLVLHKAYQSYRPGGPGFLIYLVNVCFKNHCVLHGNRIRLRLAREQEFDTAQWREIQIVDTENDLPHRQAERQAFLNALRCAIMTSGISERQRTAFTLRFLQFLSYEQTAKEMQAPLGSVKAWTHRATARIAAVLKQEGWLE